MAGKMIRLCFAAVLIVSMQIAIAADNPDIRVLMTTEELTASGIRRLSDDEIEAINRWLARYTAQDAGEIMDSSPAVQEISNAPIRTAIDGQFNGWDGPTRFRLKNGEVWETSSTRRYSYSAIDPEVEITRNWMGIHRMRILETGRAINVRLVE
jgi:hypothetical protein